MKTNSLMWHRRGQRCDNDAAARMRWKTSCGRYCLVRSRSWFGLPEVWFAMVRHGDAWATVSKHRSRTAAQRACEQAALGKARPAKPVPVQTDAANEELPKKQFGFVPFLK